VTTPQHLSDRYELGEILGFGGMSEVHLARDVRLHRDVAVKVLRADLARDPSFYLRFRREAQNAAALNHPAIVAVYDTGEAETPNGPLPYIVMEYVDGVTLRDIVHTDGPIEPKRAIEIIADACQALNFSHQHGTIHRDVKPANIMISKSGAVKVMDFGIAKALADAGNSVTQTAAVIGTAQYLSPEQARGETVDARSDVYSLGCVLYEILTGEPPFIGDSPVAVAYQHVREDPVPPSTRHGGISPELDAVVLKALTKNPENRYQSAAEMRTDLIRVHSGEAPDAPKVFTDAERTSMTAVPAHGARNDYTERIPAHRPHRTEPERKVNVGRWAIAVAILAILTVVVTVAINMISGSPRDQQVPDVAGQSRDDAVAALQTRGFTVNTEQEDSSTVRVGEVTRTDPAANSTVSADADITLFVSSGPKQAEVPDVKGLIPSEAQRRLKAAGFDNTKLSPSTSLPEDKDKVTGTIPAANSTTAITNQILIAVGSGPDSKPVPDVKGLSPDDATKVLVGNGFTKPPIVVEVDGLQNTQNQVVGTIPAANPLEKVAVDTPITLQVSRGNQFAMPSLVGKFWVDAYPQLQSLGWQMNGSNFIKLDDIEGNGKPSASVLSQDPPAGTPITATSTITLQFAK
jgi:eukaryotic-like serine/threonine-protein kinase